MLLQFVLIFFFRPTLVYTPYIYLLLLFPLQNQFSRTSLLFIAFFLGFVMDCFTNSWGVHTAAMTFIAFFLPFFTGIFSSQNTDEDIKFSAATIGYFQFGIILFVLYFVYHFLITVLWNFTLQGFGYQLLKALISTAIATFLTLLIYSLFSRQTPQENG